MKLCPECDFIYEDNQSFCDMDGKELVPRAAAEPRFRLTIPIKPADITKALPSSVPKTRNSSSLALVAVVVIVLTALVVAVYVARQRQNRDHSSQPAQPSVQALDQPTRTSTQPATEQASESQTPSDQTSGDRANDATGSSAAPEESQAASSKVSLAHSRLNPGPVSASASAATGRGPVIVRLTNGAVIKADDAWEKKEGVWYRQAGMVTFLKRSSVRSIERMAAPRSQSTITNAAGRNSSAGGVDADRDQTTKSTRSRDQLRIAKLPSATPKKESRVTSFFKKTGKLIKKPFKF